MSPKPPRLPNLKVFGEVRGELTLLDAPLRVREIMPGGFAIQSRMRFALGSQHLFRISDEEDTAVFVGARVVDTARVSAPGDDGAHLSRFEFKFDTQEQRDQLSAIMDGRRLASGARPMTASPAVREPLRPEPAPPALAGASGRPSMPSRAGASRAPAPARLPVPVAAAEIRPPSDELASTLAAREAEIEMLRDELAHQRTRHASELAKLRELLADRDRELRALLEHPGPSAADVDDLASTVEAIGDAYARLRGSLETLRRTSRRDD